MRGERERGERGREGCEGREGEGYEGGWEREGCVWGEEKTCLGAVGTYWVWVLTNLWSCVYTSLF